MDEVSRLLNSWGVSNDVMERFKGKYIHIT